jgi:hypothetical protein
VLAANDQLVTVLGQDTVARTLSELLSETDVSLARLTGPAGSGKSYIARLVAAEWREAGDRCVVGVGDSEHGWRALYPLLSGLSRAHRDWIGLASTGARSAIRVADAAAGTGGTGTTIFDAVGGAFRHRIERILRPYTALERDVILDLRRIARSHRVLLVADNAHWWDADSLRLVGDTLSSQLREVISQLRSVTVLLVDTAEEQTPAAPDPFAALTARCGEEHTVRTVRCPRELFPQVLEAFGIDGTLPEAVISQLFRVTNGHLKLAEQIGAYGAQAAGQAAAFSIDDAYLSTLIGERLASLGTVNAEVTDLLVRAALFGLSCAEQDLGCVADRRGAELRTLVRRAQDIGFVERVAEQITFSHEVIRSRILNNRPAAEMEALYGKLAGCLATLRPGDYDARAHALLQAGEPAQAREMIALAAIAQLRQGTDAQEVIQRVSDLAPEDPDLLAYVQAMAAGHAAVATGDFGAALPRLRTPRPGETTAMAAERHYLAAMCTLESQTQAQAEAAADALGSWAAAVPHEIELTLRMLLLAQQARVLAENFDAARATETLIEQRLSERARYDVEAAVMIQVQNRRSGALMVPEIAEDRIQAAVAFFRKGTSQALRDQLELYRSLTNLAAIQIRLGRDADAFAHAQEAERLAIEALDVAPRLDVLASNLVLAGYRGGAVSLPDTIDHQILVARSSEASGDSFLQRCNLAAYLLLAERDAEAASELAALTDQLTQEEIDETYLVYYCSALSTALAVARGDAEEALALHRRMDGFIEALRWPCASYIRRRQRLLGDALAGLQPGRDRRDLDRMLIDGRPVQIGQAWSYYGRVIPCVELSFWSDS